MNELAIAVRSVWTQALRTTRTFPRLSPLSDVSSDRDESMGELVNLKRFKKRGEREEAGQQAEANRALFGRTKSERKRDETSKARKDELLDQHRLDGGDAS